MKKVQLEPTLKNQSNDAYINPSFGISLIAVPEYNLQQLSKLAQESNGDRANLVSEVA
jgi:hypothetical protein